MVERIRVATESENEDDFFLANETDAVRRRILSAAEGAQQQTQFVVDVLVTSDRLSNFVTQELAISLA